jgi:hypothetical protein
MAESTKATTFLVPPEKHIGVELSEISAVLKGTLNLDDVAGFDDVSKLLESLAQFESGELRRRLKNSFRRFSAGAKKQAPITRKDKPLPQEQSLMLSEQRFLSDLSQLLSACHFEPLTQHEWDTATEVRAALGSPPRNACA